MVGKFPTVKGLVPWDSYTSTLSAKCLARHLSRWKPWRLIFYQLFDTKCRIHVDIKKLVENHES